jgi:DNA-binding XRE family transcriptional regulator
MNKVKYFREAKGYTQQDLANFLHVTKSTFSLKEGGKRAFTIPEAIVLSDVLGQPIKKIFS